MIDSIFWWVGALVCGAGALAASLFVLYLPLDYCWRKVWDFDAFRRVVDEARRQGVRLSKGDR